jgi:hypothetical protein
MPHGKFIAKITMRPGLLPKLRFVLARACLRLGWHEAMYFLTDGIFTIEFAVERGE